MKHILLVLCLVNIALADEIWRTPEVQVPVRKCTLAVDVSWNAYKGFFKRADQAEIEKRIRDEFIPILNEAWTPEAGIDWVLGPVKVRISEADCPYFGTSDGYKMWHELINQWKAEKDTFSKAIVFTECRMNVGGLAGGDYCLVGKPWGFWWHELSHNFGNGHGGQGSLEVGSMSQELNKRLFHLPRTHFYSDQEVMKSWKVMDNAPKDFPLVADYNTPQPPYAMMDSAECNIADGAKYVDIDVLANDHDVNGDMITISDFDKKSKYGADITSVVLDGKQMLRFTPTIKYQRPDSFGYTIKDKTGKTNKGNVVVGVYGKLDTAKKYQLGNLGEGHSLCSPDGEKVETKVPTRIKTPEALQWEFEDAGDEGLYYIKHQQSGKYLVPINGVKDGSKLGLRDNLADFKWTILPAQNGFYSILYPGTTLAIAGNYPNAGPIVLEEKKVMGKGKIKEFQDQCWLLDPVN